MLDFTKYLALGALITKKADSVIFEQGENTDGSLYVVQKGAVELVSTVASSEGLPFLYCEDGESFAEESTFTNGTVLYTAKTIDESVIVKFSKAAIVSICQKDGVFALALLQNLAKKDKAIIKKELVAKREIVKKVESEHVHETVSIQESVSHLFPFGFTPLNIPEPETFKDYVISETAVCPLCGKTIDIPLMLESRLSLVETKNDLHKIYKNFETAWYTIWSCPHCYYSDFHYDFEKASIFNKDEILEKLAVIKQAIKVDFSFPRIVDDSIVQYYLAIYCAELLGEDHPKFSKLWLQLSWLYDNVNATNLARQCSEKSLHHYNELYYNSIKEFDPVSEQACLLVMSELTIATGDLDKAYQMLFDAKAIKGGNRYYGIKIERRLEELRELRKNK